VQQKEVLAITTGVSEAIFRSLTPQSRAQLQINLNVLAESEGVDGPRRHVLKSIAKASGSKAPVKQVLDATQQ
jgi:hypothetical protein